MSMRPLALATLSMLLASPVLAEDEPVKRSESSYFVEAAEIMFRANDFDAVVADDDPDGFAGPAGAAPRVSKLSDWDLQQPKITFGLNRPGKTSFTFTVHDYEMADKLIPATFDVDDDHVVTSPLLPPGIVFQRQHPGMGSVAGGLLDDDFVPNWGEVYAFVNRFDYKSLDFSTHYVLSENKSFRLRLVGGLRYAELLQQLGFIMGYAQEGFPFTNNVVRDFFRVQAGAQTHGIGPHVGLDVAAFAGKKKKWSFVAQGDVAMIPETTSAHYALSLVDRSMEQVPINVGTPTFPAYTYRDNVERPVMPGMGVPSGEGTSFNAIVRQNDYTSETWLLEGTIGFRYKVTRAVSIGLEGWHMSWMNLISRDGIFDTIHEQASYEQFQPSSTNPDPQLHDTESVIHVPRFSRRGDVSFDGVSLNLRFDF